MAKERRLQKDAAAWAAPSDSSTIPEATDDEIPVLDYAAFLRDPSDEEAVASLASSLRMCCERVGFHLCTGHGVPDEMFRSIFDATKSFMALSVEAKLSYEMDKGQAPAGSGYLPVCNFKLPKRVNGNLVESFVLKRELGPRNINLDLMPWPEELGPEWRRSVEEYARAMEDLAIRMLPVYSAALGLRGTHFDDAFRSPLWRLRLSRYPSVASYGDQEFGIGPHVDTSFFTLLAQDGVPGLVVWANSTQRWVRIPATPGALVVNTGEILRQITNDTWQAARHYALNAGPEPRISVPFFFNATADYPLAVVPTCCSEEDPAKYPPTSYLSGQGVVQGE